MRSVDVSTTLHAGARTPTRHLVAFALALLGGQWLLLVNPGWFSHDELGWAALARSAPWTALPWQSWWDIESFQYRPLTFNLWLLLARTLQDAPLLFHGLWLLLGSVVALLLRQTLRRCDIAALPASLAALVFALNPYAAYVHGWVATLADLIWVGSGVALAWWLCGDQAPRAQAWRAFLMGALTALVALSAKEAAIVLAPLAWLGWWLWRRPPHWLWTAAGLSLPTLVYLLLRLDVILFQPRSDDAYGWSLSTLPLNWSAYHLYALIPSTAEVAATLQASWSRLLLAAATWLAVWAALATAGWRWLAGGVLGATLALGPVLILDTPYNQYAYGASLLVVAVVALVWPRLRGPARMAVLVAALLSTWHGINVQRMIHRVGQLEARFTPSLRAALDNHRGGRLDLAVERQGDAWIYARLSRGYFADGERRPHVRIVAGDGGSDYVAAYNGEVVASGRRAPDE